MLDDQDTLDRLDQLLNDPDVTMQPDLIWALLEQVAARQTPAPATH